MGYRMADLRRALHEGVGRVERPLAEMSARCTKYLGHNPGLRDELWGQVQAALLRRYTLLEAQMRACYPSESLSPSPQELEELFKLA
mmetsp:Transcript_64882/g.204944  ORF Transcript_64882/g.204944 Transcript_64882/m.204944 type:complete len:87 (-) Transcript_64882:57-317(-)